MQYLAGLLELIGIVMIGNKNKWGFIVFVAGAVAWVYIALTTPMYGLLIPVIPAIGLNIRNFVKWYREEK